MDRDHEFSAGYDEMAHGAHHGSGTPDEASLGGLDPLDITNPSSAYLFLSDDAEDEITGPSKKKMKCHSCGHRFAGEFYDRCPECFSSDTEEFADEKEQEYW